MIERALEKHAAFVVSRPGVVAIGLVLITVASALGLRHFSIEADLGALVPRDDPGVRLALELSQEDGTRSMLLAVEGVDLAGVLPVLEERLQESQRLTFASARRDAWLGTSDDEGLALASASTLEALAAALKPEARQSAIEESKRLLAQDPVAGRELALRDPLGLRWILQEALQEALPEGLEAGSPWMLWPAAKRAATGNQPSEQDEELDLALMLVRGECDPFDVEFSVALMDELDSNLSSIDSISAWEALGGYDVARRDSTRIRGDMVRSLSGSIPLLLLALMLSTRSWLIPHLYVLPTLVAVLWALGLGGVALGPLSPLAVSGAAILMGLGVDFCIHHVDRYREERRTYSHVDAIVRTHRRTGPGLLLGMVTTVGAFLSFATASFPGAGSFGLLLSFGLISAFVVALHALPVLLGLVRDKVSGERERTDWRRVQPLLLGRAGAILGGLAIAAALAGWGGTMAGGLRFDADPSFLRPGPDRFVNRVAALEEELGASPLGLKVLVEDGTELNPIGAGIERLLTAGEVARVAGPLAEVAGPRLTRAREEFRIATRDWRRAAEADLESAGFRVAPFGASLDDLERTLRLPTAPPEPDVEWEGNRYRTLTVFPPHAFRRPEDRRAFRGSVLEALGGSEAAAGETGLLTVDAAGLSDFLGPMLARDLWRALVIAAVVIAVLVLLALRSLQERLAAVAPVLVGLGLTLGVLVLWQFPLHPGNLLALPLILGLGIDDGLHMVLRARDDGERALATTGRSIWRTTLTTALGFGSLVFARSPAIASMGVLAAVGALACFLATLVLTPRILGLGRSSGLHGDT